MIIITGTSRGIGHSIAKLYLEQGRKVIGIGRNSGFESPNYSHLVCDLGNPEEVAALPLPQPDEELIFIHNAGILGEVNRFSEMEKTDIRDVLQVNLFAGVELLHRIVRTLRPNQPFTVVFISSGAGKRPIPSWASYCTSKAAVDMFLQTFQAEENEREHSDTRVYAFSPGVVDTGMQSTIRSADPEHFSSSERFHSLHQNNELQHPDQVAAKLLKLIADRPTDKVLYSASEVE